MYYIDSEAIVILEVFLKKDSTNPERSDRSV